ncbi:MAG TPA: prephenate dehydratase [Thermoleophilaceae bacterium]|nr:prephenate dehydratase [Thermoleophilaceae bacterium]
MRVAYLGPAGTFTEEALRASAPGGVEPVPYPTVYETVMAVHEGAVKRAFVPIENSLEGGVAATLDALATEASDVRIVAEHIHPIHHCLLARTKLAEDEVARVISHPQAMSQCAEFLRGPLAAAERVTSVSTAEAARVVSESPEPWAALSSRLAAEIYGCVVLRTDVEDSNDNETRFVWLARADDAEPERRDKTSVVFWGFNDESPGALVNVLRELSDREINLTRIESRPRRVGLGHYMFFADLEGGAQEPRVAEALDALSARVEELRVLGSYASA